MTVFFTSDTHFGHAKVIEYCKRPWLTVEDMDEALIQLWNQTVKPLDVVWHLGDFAFYNKKEDFSKLLLKLNGLKYLIAGNYDHRQTRNANGWKNVWTMDMGPFLNKRLGFPLALTHIPMNNWEEGGLHLHGHTHGGKGKDDYHKIASMPFRIDVGIDTDEWQYKPVPFDQLIELDKEVVKMIQHVIPLAKNELPNTVSVHYKTWHDDETGLRCHEARLLDTSDHRIIGAGTFKFLANWLHENNYSWKFGSNGLWDRNK